MLPSPRCALLLACLLIGTLGEKDVCQEGRCLHKNLCQQADASKLAKCLPGTVFCCQAKKSSRRTGNATGVIHQQVSQEATKLQGNPQHSSQQITPNHEHESHPSPEHLDVTMISNVSTKANKTNHHKISPHKPVTSVHTHEVVDVSTQAPHSNHSKDISNKSNKSESINVTSTVELTSTNQEKSGIDLAESLESDLDEKSKPKRSVNTSQETGNDENLSKSYEDYLKELEEYKMRRMEYEISLKEYMKALEESGYELVNGMVVKKPNFAETLFRQGTQENSMNQVSDGVFITGDEAKISIVRLDGKKEMVRLPLLNGTNWNDDKGNQERKILDLVSSTKVSNTTNEEIGTKTQETPALSGKESIKTFAVGDPENKSPSVPDGIHTVTETEQSISMENPMQAIIKLNEWSQRLIRKTLVKRRRSKDKIKASSPSTKSDAAMKQDGKEVSGQMQNDQVVNSPEVNKTVQPRREELGRQLAPDGNVEMMRKERVVASLVQHQGDEGTLWESRRLARLAAGDSPALLSHHPALHQHLLNLAQ